jgi:hypothetical protein
MSMPPVSKDTEILYVLNLQLFLYSFVNTGGGGLLTSRSIKMGPNHILVMVRIEGATS